MRLAIILCIIPLVPAQAGEDWLPRNPCEWSRSCYQQQPRVQRRVIVKHIYHNHRRDDHRRDDHYHNNHRHDDRDRSCKQAYKVVGNQHLTVDGAKQAADEVWAGTVRFHIGEKFMDLANARSVSYTCSRSSIKEAGISTLGQTLTRCEIEARPCPASRETK